MAISLTEAIANINMCSLTSPLKTFCQAHDVVLFIFLHFICKKSGGPLRGDLVVDKKYQMIPKTNIKG